MVAFATQVKRRRGTAEQNNEFTGAEGEIVVNLTDKSLRVHDGQTKGGFETLRQNMQNSVNITNCITEIPQDIKLELNNGTLTLKAGSKVYVPNGFESDGTTPKFDEVTISTDKQNTTSTSTSGTGVVFYNTISNTLFFKWDNQVSSGTSDITNYIVYRTDLNKISDGGAYGRSFPLGIITVTSGTITSIDQVFNGFGYIGSTVFALPGVKGLTPNGRNADGTLKNAYWTTSSIILRTYSSAYNGEYDIFFNGGAFGALKNTYIYDEESNYNMDSNNRYNSTYVGKASITSGTISNFAIKNAFHAVDYSDTQFIAHQAMPSDKFIDLTLGASDTRYTAPADGYVMLKGNTTVADKAYGITNESNGMRTLIRVQSSGSSFGTYMPVSARQQYSVKYEGELASGYTFRFVYANGAK